MPAPVPGVEVDRVVLTGFMGSGKTTVGRVVAERLGWRFVDLDDAVSRRERRTVPQIFAESGEAAFREAEVRALAQELEGTRVVIALGGGAPGTPAIRELLAAAHRSAVVHLHAPFAVLYERCAKQARDPSATERPLLADTSAAEQRYRDRQAIYSAIAQHTFNVEAASAAQVAEAIVRALNFLPDSAV